MVDFADLLFEIGCEELPANSINKLSDALKTEFSQRLSAAHLSFEEIINYGTPRRLSILVRNCSYMQNDYVIEKRGPSISQAFDNEGKPTKAALGFAKSCGTDINLLEVQSTNDGSWLFFKSERRGLSSLSLLPGIARDSLDALPIQKRMRWGSNVDSFIRPVQWLLFIHGEEIVPCSLFGIESSNVTYGHRFHSSSALLVKNPNEYEFILSNHGYVIPNFAVRRNYILNEIQKSADRISARVEIDDELLDEVTNLVEWPNVLIGSFDEHFLNVPHEALVLTMKVNQRYFSVFDSNGQLLSKFITVANIDSKRKDIVTAGNERVIRPRLADAMFFWQHDCDISLSSRLDFLKNLVFHKQLGSIYDKTIRVFKIAQVIGQSLNVDVDLIKAAALLSRCDLTTKMVFEFPELQGTIGSYIALGDKAHPDIVKALYEFYFPRFSGDQLPSSHLSISINLADKIDTLVTIFSIGLRPTGDKDPYALRRCAIGILRVLLEKKIELDLKNIITNAVDLLPEDIKKTSIANDVYTFILDRLKYFYLEMGLSVDLYTAILNSPFSSIRNFGSRIIALDKFRSNSQFYSLLSANKRIYNILKNDGTSGSINIDLLTDEYEIALYNAFLSIQSKLIGLLDREEYLLALLELATLNTQINSFLDHVLVNTKDHLVANNRKLLLKTIFGSFRLIADITVLEKNNG